MRIMGVERLEEVGSPPPSTIQTIRFTFNCRPERVEILVTP
jgi:hypothetical protein